MLFALFDFNVINIFNPNNHDSTATILCSSILGHHHLELILIYLRHLTTCFPHALHTASVCRTEVEDQPFHSIFTFLFQKLHTHLSLYLYPPSFLGHHLHLFLFHIALQERAILCFI